MKTTWKSLKFMFFCGLALTFLASLGALGCATPPAAGEKMAAAAPSPADEKIYQDESDLFTGPGTVPPGKSSRSVSGAKLYQDESDQFTGSGTVKPSKASRPASSGKIYRDASDRFE